MNRISNEKRVNVCRAEPADHSRLPRRRLGDFLVKKTLLSLTLLEFVQGPNINKLQEKHDVTSSNIDPIRLI